MNILQYININWLINKKPYKNYTDHDLFLLELCRELYPMIRKVANKHHIGLEDIDVRELAYVYTSYFEDVTNKIGFWQAVVNEHQILYGKRVPFVTPEAMEEDAYEDVFPADLYYLTLAYLAFLSKISKTPIYPDHAFIKELSEVVFEYLDNIEEFSVTDFYKDFLTPGDDYFIFKNKLQWFALRGYLFGYEFEFRLEEIRYQLEQRVRQTGEQDYEKMIYGLVDDLIFNGLGSLSALSPLTILSKSMLTDKKQLANLLRSKERINGVYKVVDRDEQYVEFEHLFDKKSYSVLKSSFHKGGMYGPFCRTTLVQWEDDYLISGLCVFLSHYEVEKDEEEQYAYLQHDEVYQEKLNRELEVQHQAMLEYFGDELLICKNGKEAVDKINGFRSWQLQEGLKSDILNKTQQEEPVLKYEDLPEPHEVAICFTPEGRYCIVPNFQKIISLLKQADTPEDLKQLSWCLAEESIDAQFWLKLIKYLGRERPNTLFRGINIHDDKDFQAMIRVYKAQNYAFPSKYINPFA